MTEQLQEVGYSLWYLGLGVLYIICELYSTAVEGEVEL